MFVLKRKAFSMIELVFVIVVIGILASVAIPKFAVTRDDAEVTKAKATLASVRSSLATIKQKRILSGDFTLVTDLGDATYAFGSSILEYPVANCATQGCWQRVDAIHYTYHYPVSGRADFNLTNNRLICQNNNCALLEN
jgi:general secretion pathway protein G